MIQFIIMPFSNSQTKSLKPIIIDLNEDEEQQKKQEQSRTPYQLNKFKRVNFQDKGSKIYQNMNKKRIHKIIEIQNNQGDVNKYSQKNIKQKQLSKHQIKHNTQQVVKQDDQNEKLNAQTIKNLNTNYNDKEKKQPSIIVEKQQSSYSSSQTTTSSSQPSSMSLSFTLTGWYANTSYSIPLKINKNSHMINRITYKYQSQNKQLYVSRYQGDKWQIVPALFDFRIPPRGKYTLKMQVMRSRDYTITLGITTMDAVQRQWQRIVPCPNMCYVLNKCALSERSNPDIIVQNEIYTQLKRIYTQIEMQIDMDKGEIYFYMKNNKNKKVGLRISEYLLKQSRESYDQNDNKKGLMPFVGFRYDYDQVRFYN